MTEPDDVEERRLAALRLEMEEAEEMRREAAQDEADDEPPPD